MLKIKKNDSATLGGYLGINVQKIKIKTRNKLFNIFVRKTGKWNTMCTIHKTKNKGTTETFEK